MDMEKVLVLRTLENKKILSDVVLMLICKSHGKYLNILRKEYLHFCLHHRKATNRLIFRCRLKSGSDAFFNLPKSFCICLCFCLFIGLFSKCGFSGSDTSVRFALI